MSASTLHAHAKLTRSLRVTGVRNDGYHLIDAEMVSLELADILTLQPAATTVIEVTGEFREGVPTDERNLCIAAADLSRRTLNISLEKRIPHGGGLGGGSTDAAAVLRWAELTDPAVTVTIGADVPFCVAGGRARVEGIGELITPLPHLDLVYTLIIPPLSVSTPAVYSAWDELGGPTNNGLNDLEPAALRVEPRLDTWKQRITRCTGVEPTLAGSGATWFLEGVHDDALDELLAEGAVVRVTRTIDNRR